MLSLLTIVSIAQSIAANDIAPLFWIVIWGYTLFICQ